MFHKTCTFGSRTSIQKAKRNPSWHRCLPATRHGHACKQDNTINGRLLKAQEGQPNENRRVLRNLLRLNCYLIHKKFRPVSSQKPGEISLWLHQYSNSGDPKSRNDGTAE